MLSTLFYLPSNAIVIVLHCSLVCVVSICDVLLTRTTWSSSRVKPTNLIHRQRLVNQRIVRNLVRLACPYGPPRYPRHCRRQPIVDFFAIVIYPTFLLPLSSTPSSPPSSAPSPTSIDNDLQPSIASKDPDLHSEQDALPDRIVAPLTMPHLHLLPSVTLIPDGLQTPQKPLNNTQHNLPLETLRLIVTPPAVTLSL